MLSVLFAVTCYACCALAADASEVNARVGRDLADAATNGGTHTPTCTIGMLQEAGALDEDLGLPTEYPKIIMQLRLNGECNKCAHSCWNDHIDTSGEEMKWKRADGMDGQDAMRSCTMKCVTVKKENAVCSMDEYNYGVYAMKYNPNETDQVGEKRSKTEECGKCMQKCNDETMGKSMTLRKEFDVCLGCCSGIELDSHSESAIPNPLKGKTCENAVYATFEEPKNAFDASVWEPTVLEPEEEKGWEGMPPGRIVMIVILALFGVVCIVGTILAHDRNTLDKSGGIGWHNACGDGCFRLPCTRSKTEDFGSGAPQAAISDRRMLYFVP